MPKSRRTFRKNRRKWAVLSFTDKRRDYAAWTTAEDRDLLARVAELGGADRWNRNVLWQLAAEHGRSPLAIDTRIRLLRRYKRR